MGFQTIVARSLEFLATGRVTLPIPSPFPLGITASIVPPHQVNWQSPDPPVASSHWKQKKEANPFVLLTPEEERQSFQLRDGYVAELVAAEPLVREPVLSV